MTEHRTFRNVEVRAAEGEGPNGRPVVELRAITPGAVDDYGSVWNPACFDEDVQGRMKADPDDTPALAWAHNWSDPIGHGISYTASDEGPTIGFELDDFDAVPRAKQADAQVRSRTIRDCSVGFSVPTGGRRDPTEDEQKKYPGIREVIEVANLEEVSLVMRGAVPGAKVLALRTAAGSIRQVPEEFVIGLAKQVAGGTLSKAEAAAALDLAAGETPPVVVQTPEPTPDDVGDADQVLEQIGL